MKDRIHKKCIWGLPGVAMVKESIVYTNDHCIGCNKCISVCSAIGACISTVENGKPRIIVDGKRCVGCGSCIDVCEHDARGYRDDTERFFEDLKKGNRISLLLAPAFKANYPYRYGSILGGLKNLGVNRIISVSFGADITTWGYINYINKHDFTGGISQPCPAVVSYIERYLPELLPKLFPVQSPLMCAAIYARKELGITDRLAFISPCIEKKVEIEDPHNAGLVQYNVTFDHLIKYVNEHKISGPFSQSEIEYGMGAFYPTPGGLAETVRWFLGDSIYIRQMEGEKRMYKWMHDNEDRIKFGETPYLFIDALNCENGCICGTAVEPEKAKTEDALYALLKIREETKKKEGGSPWSRFASPAERLKAYNKQFENLRLEDYLRQYTDRSAECAYRIPNHEELEKIFTDMNKLSPEDRKINCTCCGYQSCSEMAMAIHNGFNRKENCIHYEKDMVQKLEVKSSTDLLTGLLNKITFEEMSKYRLSVRAEYERCALLIFDFDDFKSINDVYGHKTGDEVLRAFGELLRHNFKRSDLMGRIGGDEFMVLLMGDIPEAGISSRCDAILDMLRELKVGDAGGFSCSIGVVIDDMNIGTFDELYQLCDDALYEAKARGKARHIRWYTKPILPLERDAVMIVTDNDDHARRIREMYQGEYDCIVVSDATSALNEISLYRKYVKHIYFDYSMPEIAEQVVKEYIETRPMFADITVNEVCLED